jgi:dTDP-4-amino-4,6-dideoxygalactose transaminase
MDGLKDGWSRDRIVTECTARNIPVLHGSCSEVYLEKAYDGTPWRPSERLPVTRELGETSLMFLTHPNQSDEDVDRVCGVLSEVMNDACR